MTRGEENPMAQLTDDDVELMRSLREAEQHLPKHMRHWTARRLAEKFEVSRRQVWNILSYKQRVLGGGE